MCLHVDFLGVECRDELFLHLFERINPLSADSIHSTRVVDGCDSWMTPCRVKMKEKSLNPMKGKSKGQRAGREDTCALTSLDCRDKRTVVPSDGRAPIQGQSKERGPDPRTVKGKTFGGKVAAASVCVCRSSCLGLGFVLVRCVPCPLPCLLLFLGTVPEDQTRHSRYPLATASPWWSVLPGLHGSYVWRRFSTLSCRLFEVADVEASHFTCCRGSRVSPNLVHVVEATLLPTVAAQANSGRLIYLGTYLADQSSFQSSGGLMDQFGWFWDFLWSSSRAQHDSPASKRRQALAALSLDRPARRSASRRKIHVLLSSNSAPRAQARARQQYYVK